jgi:hypothetical protein
LGGDPRAILARVDSESDVTIQQAFLFILGESSDTPLSIAQRQPLVEKLLHMYENEPDAGLHAAAEWLLRKWEPGERLNVLIEKLKADEHALQARRHHDKRQWYVNSQGQTFVIVEPGEFQMGSPIGEPGHVANEIRRRRRITRRFAIAATEVTRKAASRGPSLVSPQSNFVKTEDSPETGFDWYGAAQYCNWLSEQEGIPPDQWCYEPNEEGKYAPGMKAKSDFLDLHGYRLPVEVEWEYACRAGTVTSRYFGESESLLPEYAWYLANAENRTWPVGSLKPNGWGLFNMLGNAAEWCHDQYFGLPPTMDPSEAVIGKPDTAARVLRGGAFDLASVSIRSATRLFYQPGNRHVTNGFRPAKTCP